MSRCSLCECKIMNCVCDPYDKGYAEGRADAMKELLGSARKLWTTAGNLKAIKTGKHYEINVWTYPPDITDLVPVKLLKMELDKEVESD